MSGRWVEDTKPVRRPRHSCSWPSADEFPAGAGVGAVWECDCGKRWRAVNFAPKPSDPTDVHVTWSVVL